MCGRYNIVTNASALVDAFNIIYNDLDFSAPIYNASPTATNATPEKFHRYPVIRNSENKITGTSLVWPLVPKWANGKISKYSTANTMAETMAEKNSFKFAWKNGQRCLIPATGFFEWQVVSGQKNKQPYNIKLRQQDLFAMAGLWEESAGIESYTIITTQANKLMEEIHNTRKRMPVILRPEQYELWLNAPTPDDAMSCIQSFPDEEMEAYKISTAVNNPGFDDPKVLEPVEENDKNEK